MAETATLVTTTTKIKSTDTVATIKSLLDLLEIPYPRSATKAELLPLVPDSNLAEAPLSNEASSSELLATDYVVQQGDTIASIATRHGMSVAKLKELNPPLKLKFKTGCVLKLI